MSDKLSEEKLTKDQKRILKSLNYWRMMLSSSGNPRDWTIDDKYSFHKIEQLIQNQQIVALIKKLEVTEGRIGEKAKELASMIIDYMPYGSKSGEPFEVSELEDFLRSFVEEIRGK